MPWRQTKRFLRRLRRLRQDRLAKEVILVLGDSHADVFKHWSFELLCP